MRLNFALAAASLLILIQSSPLRADDPPAVQDLDTAAATKRQFEMIKRGPPDLSVVYIARLKFGDQQIDVTSLAPSVVSHVETRTGPLVSVIRFSQDRHTLELLSRDPKNGGGKFMAMPIAQVPQTVSFPVLTDGKLVDTTIALLFVTHKP